MNINFMHYCNKIHIRYRFHFIIIKANTQNMKKFRKFIYSLNFIRVTSGYIFAYPLSLRN